MFLHDFGTKSRFSFGILILQTTWFTANLHDFGTKSRFSFGILILQTAGLQRICHLGTKLFSLFDPDPWDDFKSRFSFGFRTLILQNQFICFGQRHLHDSCFTGICMILGLNLDSVFGSWSFKKKDETNVYKCLQKPLIHDAKLILEILLFGSWSSKLPVFTCFCMILGLNPDSVLGSLILQTTWFTANLHDFGTKSRFSFGILDPSKSRFNFWILILQKKTNVYKSL